MRKCILFTIVLFLAIIAMLSSAFADKVCKVDIKVTFNGNLIFSKYDVELYINNQSVDVLKHGTDYAGTVYVNEGTNTLYFYKVDDHNLYGKIEWTVKSSELITCTISCNRNGVDVAEIKHQAYPEEKEVADLESTDEKVIRSMKDQVLSLLTVKPSNMKDAELNMLSSMLREEQSKRNTVVLTLQEEDLTIKAGETKQLSAFLSNTFTDEPVEAEFSWTSEHLEVATCKNGTVVGVSGGQTKITCKATLPNGFVLSRTCNVKVNAVAEEVASEETEIDLMKGDTYALNCWVLPEDAVVKDLTYASEDEYIATVDNNGNILGNHAGETSVVVKTTDGTDKSVSILVRVISETYLEDSNAKKMFEEITSDRELSMTGENGDEALYDRVTSFDGLILSVKSAGPEGDVQFLTAIDVQCEDSFGVFSEVLSRVFNGDDAVTALDWLKANLGKSSSVKIKDANVVLKVTDQKKMILYISDDDHIAWTK